MIERVQDQDTRFYTRTAQRASHEFGMWCMEVEFEIIRDFIEGKISREEKEQRKKELDGRSPWDGKGLSWKENGCEKHV